jgi:hypothetical protein
VYAKFEKHGETKVLKMLLDNMIGLREDSRVMVHGDYKMEKEFKLIFFFSFSFYQFMFSFSL